MRHQLNIYKTRVLAILMTATVAICTLPFFIGSSHVEAAVLSDNALVSESDARYVGYQSEQDFRDAVLSACEKLDGVKYEWGGGGWNGIDCAGSVSIAYAYAMGTVTSISTSGSYGSKSLSYSGGGNPDAYGFYRPGFAGIRTSFTNGILQTKGISISENHFSAFDTNGTHGIQSDEWLTIINTYGFKPGDMILWWNDDNDSTNPQHITIYAGVEEGVPMHWTGSSSMGYFCKKPLANSSAEAGKGSFTGFMGLRATEPFDTPYVGFYIDKKDPSGIRYTCAIFSVYSDSSLTTKIGELHDDDGNGIYTDYYALNSGSYSLQKFELGVVENQPITFGDTVYLKETSYPTGTILPNGTKMSLKDSSGNVPGVYQFIDQNTFTVNIWLSGTNGSTGTLEYSVSDSSGSVIYSGSVSNYSYVDGSNAVVIANSSDGTFSDGSSLSLSKTTSTGFDITSTVFTVTEGSSTLATYKYADGSWNWYDVNNQKWDCSDFPIKYSTSYKVTESFSKPAPFRCVDGNTLEYAVSNSTSGWTKVSDTSYSYSFTSGVISSRNTFSLTAENNTSVGRVKVVKNITDEDDTRDGFSFELWNESKTVLLATGVSSSEGTVYWETGSGTRLSDFSLPSGNYVLAEIVPSRCYDATTNEFTYKVPEGFTDGGDGKWYKSITVGSDLLTVSVTNDRTECSISVNKTSEDEEVSGVGFELYYGGKTDDPVWQSDYSAYGTTDSEGNLEFTDLPTGWYRIDEVVEPIYSPVWDDNTEGASRIVHITDEDDNKTFEVSAYNRLDINPEISTELTGEDSSHDVWCGSTVVITDKVAFENLTAGYEYVITGVLVDKTTGEIITDSEGDEYESTVTFIADGSVGDISYDEQGRAVVSGYVEVPFEVNTLYLYETAFAGSEDSVSIVCFETLRFRGITIAEHSDLEDEDQTVIVAPRISTSATDSGTGTSVLTLSDTVGIIDEVSYEGLAPGESFVVTGTLMDKEKGLPYVDDKGNTYMEEVVFVPESSIGTVTVRFKDVLVTTDSIELVVFERLRAEDSDTDIAIHEDLEDQDQTVGRPTCTTYATTSWGYKTFLNSTKVTIVDHVSYEGLEPGETYYARASLVLNDGTSIVNNGQEVVSLQEFVPEGESGTVEVTIRFDASELEVGDVVVVYETIFDKSTDEEVAASIQSEDIMVLLHEYPDNLEQSLAVTSVPTLGDVASNKMTIAIGVSFIVIGAAGIVLVFEVRRRRVKKG